MCCPDFPALPSSRKLVYGRDFSGSSGITHSQPQKDLGRVSAPQLTHRSHTRNTFQPKQVHLPTISKENLKPLAGILARPVVTVT